MGRTPEHEVSAASPGTRPAAPKRGGGRRMPSPRAVRFLINIFGSYRMITREQIPTVLDHPVHDARGDKIGDARHVFFDDVTGEPEWVSVRTGLFGTSESFVPIHDAALVEDHLEVPYAKDKVKDAPNVDIDMRRPPVRAGGDDAPGEGGPAVLPPRAPCVPARTNRPSVGVELPGSVEHQVDEGDRADRHDQRPQHGRAEAAARSGSDEAAER